MSIRSGKHVVVEMDGVRCTVVEKGISMDRVNFLKDILEFNGYAVKYEEGSCCTPSVDGRGAWC